MIYLCQCDNVTYVAEAMSNEEATIKLFNNMVRNPAAQKAMAYGLRPIRECTETVVSTPELREALYGGY